jgi:hypothetical protein
MVCGAVFVLFNDADTWRRRWGRCTTKKHSIAFTFARVRTSVTLTALTVASACCSATSMMRASTAAMGSCF